MAAGTRAHRTHAHTCTPRASVFIVQSTETPLAPDTHITNP